MLPQISSILTLIILESRQVHAGVIPLFARVSIKTRDHQTDYTDEEDFDLNVMLFSLGTMFLMYLLVCVIYLIVKFILSRVVNGSDRLNGSRNQRISLTRGEHDLDRNTRIIENMNLRWPTVLDDPEEVRGKIDRLSPEEQFYYRQGEEYIRNNPPILIDYQPTESNEIIDPIINEQTKQFIEEEGANAWEFEPDSNLPNDTILIENKTEVSFLNYNYDASVTTNLPIPCINRVYYCEFKIFEVNTPDGKINNNLNNITNPGPSTTLATNHADNNSANQPLMDNIDENDRTSNVHSLASSLESLDEFNVGNVKAQNNELISFGLSTSPYPYFRLPGRHHHSIAYDSTGGRRLNDSFMLESHLQNLFPAFQKGDVIGIGYRTRSGTVFFTRNGKKLSEKSVGGHVRGWKFKYLYPVIGANVPCRVHVNFGTYGFVYIEANVKKWGYAKINGMKLPPPSYENYGQDTLLESGEEDNDDEDDGEENSDSIRNSTSGIVATDEGLRDMNGKLLPPPPGFEFSTSPESKLIQEEINMNSLPMEPPTYSDNESSYAFKFHPRNSTTSSRNIPIVGSSKRLSAKTLIGSSANNRLRNSPDDKDDYDFDDDDYDYDEYEIPEDENNEEDVGDEEIETDEDEEEITDEMQHMISQQ
ncbi:similar to Saccharomyces cerevisiae YMR171C EAR1 Specificity factor required for Rsp5p- dependent ubiquitination and sorting of specific cargo proteins at the multivesicular body [Maudiozyma barnettii]|uniref:Similar to Saccharomyces cerevisiae YMR171C EAR1 Specificity factor required for Rsp5p- dependent ubiquitination and sorting of specific cargo proteins at the multivesicular body n=1 Tax=Maudiozyma barnettii TaxID=61262 RepID=A0A8H2VFY0_9SACH|nr:Ear1p [Kazachstania barnettii]CAB4254503.1 similar to Saccharomyces cerevisiae YMR171C EAR1 Specificity factor required for Rsp5p- dependent ubiquitination and sorting of specific cargo proteins at the multivesicular body [Kazachstania barnettii]CAD1782517.1 similar to Saccharomyces cerevisiae YMR171C EAR1 Specificity factor required for Rsp5p- dependent ubiquitination and sorting of specific cargo proteins at the multivesicular body [Kazachstania barnettii]